MKRILAVLVLTISSLASMTAIGRDLSVKTPTTITATPTKTATKNVQARASASRIPKFKVLRGNPHRVTHIVLDDWDDDIVDDEGLMPAYRRRDFTVKTDVTPDNPEGLSEDIQWKLFLARQLAMLKYREIHGA